MKFRIILGLIYVIIVVFIFIYIEFTLACGLSIFGLIFYLAVVLVHFENGLESDSFKDPCNITTEDAGKILKVTHIQGNRIGLVRWGYTEYGIGKLDRYSIYYVMWDIPVELRNIGDIFKVESTTNGVVFKKIQVNGFEDKSKKPFEILNNTYRS